MKRATVRVKMVMTLAAVGAALAALAAAPPALRAQSSHTHHVHVTVTDVVVPQARSFAAAARTRVTVQVTKVDVGVVIVEQVATTTMDITMRNAGGRRTEARLLVPVPDGAVVRGFTFSGAAKEPTAEVLPKDDAKATYDSIVAKVKDPALLEFAGYNLIQTSVFPVEAGGEQKVRLTYEHLLPADGDRVDYMLPRSEAVDYTVPWTFSVRVKSKRPISTVYSPSHPIDVRRTAPGVVSARVLASAATEPGPFLLSYLLQRNGITTSVLAYPDPKTGGGYFLMLTGLPASLKVNGGAGIQREVTLVFDRSGSMRGEKLEQVREAAIQIIHGLDQGEAFNIITYNASVDFFAAHPVVKSPETVKKAEEYLKGVTAQGGTNLHDALLEALRQEPTGEMLPIVLFLTDGLPTVGQTSEKAITDLAAKANPHKRRVFTFGAGVDVNTPLLERIALDTRATATFVLPKEDVEAKVGQVFKRLVGPVLAEPALAVLEKNGEPALGRVRDLMPSRLPDLFEGDQLVVLGRYAGTEPLVFTLSGNYLGKKRTFKFDVGFTKATTRNAFVPRLWASRKIAVLVDAVRALGADPATYLSTSAVPKTNGRLKELVDEIVRLSTEFGILTEYTAFLAREGTDLNNRDEILHEATANFKGRAISSRVGIGSVNQSVNNDFQRGQRYRNGRNWHYDAKMQRVEITNVQQINDRAFYQRGSRWIDSRLANRDAQPEPNKVIEFGSPEFRELLARLTRENRQGTVSLPGEIVMVVDGETVLVKPPAGN